MNLRVIAKSNLDFDDYVIHGRVYSLPTFKNRFAVVVVIYLDGYRHKVLRDTVIGLHCARKSMMELTSDLHGNA